MGAGNCALTLATPENLEVMGDAGLIYESVDELAAQLRRVIAEPSIIGEYRHRAMARVMQFYNWEQITDLYEVLLARLAGDEALASARASSNESPLAYPLPAFDQEQPEVKVRRAARTPT
jgi:hypothetical protein